MEVAMDIGYCLIVIGIYIWGFINGRKSKSEEFLRDKENQYNK